MRALVYERPGELVVREVPRPEPGEGEALVRVTYAGICGTDLHIWHSGTGAVPGVVLGHEVVGEVIESRSDRVRPGERVALEPLWSCGQCRACREGHGHVCRNLKVLGVHADGGAAEYERIAATRLHRVPDNLTWEQAACTEPTAVAVHMTRRAGIQLGDTVLVLGGGPIGYLVASVARAAGARQVLVSEISPARLEFCRQAGFEVIDARAEDPVERVRAVTEGEGADVVVEAVGHPSTTGVMINAARVRGTVLLGGIYPEPPAVELRLAITKELTLVGSRVYESRDVQTALNLLASGRVDVSKLVTRVVPLERAVADGFAVLSSSPSEMKVLLAP